MQTKTENTQVWIDKRQAAALAGLSPETLRKYRYDGLLIEGIHWQAFGSRCVRYHKDMLLHFFSNFNDPKAHQAFIDIHRKGLEAQKKKMAKGIFAFA
jgi:hypothetical protein